jgi:hypothetical protein
MKSTKYFSAIFFLLINCLVFAQSQPLLHLKYNENYTPTYDEVMEMYRLLDKNYANAKLFEKGLTDTGKPLHLFVINSEPEFNPEKIKQQGKTILMINNGIHPGEPEGIDASLKFADDILRNKDDLAKLLENTVIIIIPVYNIGGHLNRSAYNRSGQTTPYETGFRGNAKNLDLNRDFTKCDSENAKSFTKIFQEWQPDVLLDTHTTNGSDHQYSITLISPEPDLFPTIQDKFLRDKFIPGLYSGMKKGKYELIPYVEWLNNEPKKGIELWKDGARYSSGFASLFNCYGMITENHIYKDYPDRVESCYQFIETLANLTSKNSADIKKVRTDGEKESMKITEYPVAYELDTTKFQMIEFKGYAADNNMVSPVTGVKRFGYDRSKPYTKEIPYYDTWKPTEFVKVPEFYILPQAYRDVIMRLDNVGVSYSTLKKDSMLVVTVDYIDEFTSPRAPYNGHYYHDKIKTHSEVQTIAYYQGDLLIPVRQKRIKYIVEMLEPKATDSFFRWNFFDNILDQREYFSSYGFEENALKYLKEHPDFSKKFQEKRNSDPDFAQNHRAQMAFIYNNSEWHEKTWKRYPVGKIY